MEGQITFTLESQNQFVFITQKLLTKQDLLESCQPVLSIARKWLQQ
jgi:hypothetical protein